MSPGNLAAALAVLAGAAAGGYCLVRFFAGELSRRERAGWSLACGVLLLAAASGAFLAAGLIPGPKKFAAVLALLAIVSLLARRPGTTPSPVRRTEGASLLPAILNALAVALVLLFAVQAARRGLGTEDHVAIWGLKAKTIFATSSVPARLFDDPALAFSRPQEPLLVPLTLSAVAAAMRAWNSRVLALLDPFFALATVLVVSGFLARRVSRQAGAAAGLLVALLAPLYSLESLGGAEIPLALGFVLAATALLDALERETAGACARLLLASLFCSATKAEGTLFVLLLLASLLARSLRGRPVPRVAALALFLPAGLHAAGMGLLLGKVPGPGIGRALPSLSRLGEAGLEVVGTQALTAALPLLALGLLLLVSARGIADPLLPPLTLQLLAAAFFGSVAGRSVWEAQLAFGRAALPLLPIVALVAAARAFALESRDGRALAGSRERPGGITAAAPIGLLLLALVAVPQAIRGVSGERGAPLVALARPTFHASVEPILQASCQTCHRPGGIAPFSLLSYEDAESQGRSIRRQVASRQMPPWKAGEDCGEFSNDPSLSEREIATIVRWVDSGSPRGDPKDAAPPRKFSDGWELGTPDLVLDAPEYTPDFSKGDIYQCFVLPTNLDANAWVSAVEVKPGNRAMVHHALLYVEEGIVSRDLEEQALPGPGYPCFGGPRAPVTDSFGEWAPGMQPRFYPDGVARFLPRKSRIIMQVHYSALFGRVEPDRSQVGIFFAKGPVTRRLLSDDVRADAPFTIPAGAVSHTLRGRLGPLPSRAELVAILPHMHLLGRTMKVTARSPDGTERCLVDVEDWDLRWQRTYFYKRPVVLPAGTVLELEATFDNSYANPHNPSEPLVDVHFGERTTDEMCMALLFWTVDGKNPGEKDAFFRGAVCSPSPPLVRDLPPAASPPSGSPDPTPEGRPPAVGNAGRRPAVTKGARPLG